MLILTLLFLVIIMLLLYATEKFSLIQKQIKEIIELMGLHFNMRVDMDELQKLQAMKRTPENAT